MMNNRRRCESPFIAGPESAMQGCDVYELSAELCGAY